MNSPGPGRRAKKVWGDSEGVSKKAKSGPKYVVPASDFDARNRCLPVDLGGWRPASCQPTPLAACGRGWGCLPPGEPSLPCPQSRFALRFFQLRGLPSTTFRRDGGPPSRVPLVGGAHCRRVTFFGRSPHPSSPQGGPKVLSGTSENATLATSSSAAGPFPSGWTSDLAGISSGQYVLQARGFSAPWVDPPLSPGGPKSAGGPFLHPVSAPAEAQRRRRPRPDSNTT